MSGFGRLDVDESILSSSHLEQLERVIDEIAKVQPLPLAVPEVLSLSCQVLGDLQTTHVAGAVTLSLKYCNANTFPKDCSSHMMVLY